MTKATLNNLTISRAIAPEDIRSGVYVMIMHELYQLPMLTCSGIEPEVTVLQVAMRPFHTDLPSRVVCVCLPFVVVETPDKKTEMIDTRKTRLARVGKRFAKAARKPHEPKKDRKGQKSKSKKKRKRSKG